VTIGAIDHRPDEDSMEYKLLDLAGWRRSPAALASFHLGPADT